jgi:hypothetical protein
MQYIYKWNCKETLWQTNISQTQKRTNSIKGQRTLKYYPASIYKKETKKCGSSIIITANVDYHGKTNEVKNLNVSHITGKN